jgi:hypothetical protein
MHITQDGVASPPMQRHLVHVGYPKAGSTTLQAWFESRPELVFAYDAIGGVTCADGIAGHVAATDGAPRWVVTSAERLITPSIEGPGVVPTEPIAARRRRVCARLRTMFGDATILIVTRGFRSAIASTYSEVLRWGLALSVKEAVLLYQESRAFEGWRAADVFDYDAPLRLYADTFGAESVVVLPFELLRDDPRGFLARLEQRLELEPRSEQPPWHNRSLSGAELYWYPRLSRGVERATNRLGRPGAALQRSYKGRVVRSGRLEHSVDVVRRVSRRVIRVGRLERSVAALSRVSRMPTVNPADEIPAGLVESCRGRASSLATNPDYAPYAADYLNDR